MYKFCVFAGTTEGRKIVDFLTEQEGCFVAASVATEYGEELIKHRTNLHIYSGRMKEQEMETLLGEGFDLVIDATHPYASEVTKNIMAACEKKNCKYIRVLRESINAENAVYFSSIEEAVKFLNSTQGNILLTTGSKEIIKYKEIENFSERVWARVLPLEESIESCKEAGLAPSHIIAMQGPFSTEMNVAMLKSTGAKYLVTKDGGAAGGFAEKLAAAETLGITPVVIGRPSETEGLTIAETFNYLEKTFGFVKNQSITIAGIGPGSEDMMTEEVRRAMEDADVIIGARRMLSAGPKGKTFFEAVRPEEIEEYIREHEEFERVLVLMSGDVGFYSGAKKLLEKLRGRDIKLLPGLSSLSVLASRVGVSYEDICPISLHGRESNIVGQVKRNAKVFVLTGGENSAAKICRDLVSAGLGRVKVYIGENLSYPDERIIKGTAEELADSDYEKLSAMIIENKDAEGALELGFPDDSFKRLAGVPMTKSEIRAICMSKLKLKKDSVCWDVGSGTGSVSVEMALQACCGKVYAVEKKEEACRLAEENKAAFGVTNLEIIEGSAPEACEDLPCPTHVFIGGSSGRLREIIGLALGKNPEARIVATAITLESISELKECMEEYFFDDTEVVSVTVARDKKAGEYHIMTGQNPIYIFTMQKR